MWQLKTVVFLHWRLICAILLVLVQLKVLDSAGNKHPSLFCRNISEVEEENFEAFNFRIERRKKFFFEKN